ncbi:hypothetical protein [Noviherbaspirillum suwonense]|jgi:hypothetical protein|uniref:hypothetical protein n=1 Tax=Noviherbaspirillum suwonense TaxID=1224511 RepID=UPI0024B828A2|nr:hypothetical protein [Noviherbaspirillum suwonense]
MQQLTDSMPAPLQLNLSLSQLAEVLIKHHSIHEGLYDVSFHFQIAVGAVGPQGEQVVPGAMIGINGIGLAKTENPGPHTVDAAVCNPVKKSRKKDPT